MAEERERDIDRSNNEFEKSRQVKRMRRGRAKTNIEREMS